MSKNAFQKILISIGVLIVLITIMGSITARKLSKRLYDVDMHLARLEQNIASTTVKIEGMLTKTKTDLSNALDQQKQNVGTIEQRLGVYQQQVGSIGGTVNTLQKLSKTDPQFLAKYSKVFFLSENYIPARLVEVPDKYKYSDTKHPTVLTDIYPHLEAMIGDASREGVTLYVSSAYRSFAEQQALKGQYKITYGSGTANQFSADQGYSEHQLGTTIDFITPGLGGVVDGFEKTKAYEWLMANAYRSGFILSYPKDNKFYVFEPWHWRYVGVKLATDLHNAGQNFYEWDQRKIDEYLINFFE